MIRKVLRQHKVYMTLDKKREFSTTPMVRRSGPAIWRTWIMDVPVQTGGLSWTICTKLNLGDLRVFAMRFLLKDAGVGG